MVYGRYIELLTMVYKPTNIAFGGHHLVYGGCDFSESPVGHGGCEIPCDFVWVSSIQLVVQDFASIHSDFGDGLGFTSVIGVNDWPWLWNVGDSVLPSNMMILNDLYSGAWKVS